MAVFPFMNIRAKATLLILVLLAATTLVSYVITVRIMNNHIADRVIQTAESLGRSIAPSAGFLMGAKDLLGLDYMVYQIRKTNPDIKGIGILGPDRDIIVHSDIKERGRKMEPAGGELLRKSEDGTSVRKISGAPGSLIEIESPIVFMNKNLGSVVLSVDWSVLLTAQGEARGKVIGLFAVILALGAISSIFLSSSLTKPIKELSSGVEYLKRGKMSKPLRIFSTDELGRLTASFNEMSGLITSQRDRLARNAQELEEAYVSTVRVVAAAIDARDSYTLGHSTRVSDLAVALAKEVGLTGQELDDMEIACLFHDVGKIKIPDAILHKTGRLDPAEWKEMRRHPEYGADILGKAPSLRRFIPAVRHHHEWYDGSGYPDGLSREGIPREAAIISLADAYDAMTSDRPYRAAMTKEKALSTIREFSGKQFSPELTPIFLEIVEKTDEPAVMAPRSG
ncbi:MAG: HD domain-containing phosphohydrolase [Candidatus Aminicenantales bacterium]